MKRALSVGVLFLLCCSCGGGSGPDLGPDSLPDSQTVDVSHDADASPDLPGPDGEGACVGNPVVNCADDNDCTVDSCNPLDGQCLHAAAEEGTTCTYPNKTNPSSCVSAATCDAAKTCVAKTLVCDCEATADCLAKEDGNACNGTLVCDKGSFPYTCKVDPATVKTCATTNDTDCKKNTCNPVDGSCALASVADTTP